MTNESQPLFTYVTVDRDSGEHRTYLSFLDEQFVFEHGLPAGAVIGQVPGNADALDPEQFAVNTAFVEFLHACIERHAARCPALLAEARRQRDGHVYIIDRRTPTPTGEVPPQDILGAVGVQGGSIQGYQQNSNHRVLTRDGIVTLDAWMFERLLSDLRQSFDSK